MANSNPYVQTGDGGTWWPGVMPAALSIEAIPVPYAGASESITGPYGIPVAPTGLVQPGSRDLLDLAGYHATNDLRDLTAQNWALQPHAPAQIPTQPNPSSGSINSM